jgi:O-methyltransferase
MKYIKMSLFLAILLSNSPLKAENLNTLEDHYLSLIEKCRSGSIYFDDEVSSNYSFLVQQSCPQNLSAINHESLKHETIDSLRERYLNLVIQCINGTIYSDNQADPKINQIIREKCRYTLLSLEPLHTLKRCMEAVEREQIPGDFVEAGIWKGGAVILMRAFLNAYQNTTRFVWGADSFAGFPASNHSDAKVLNNQIYPWVVVEKEEVEKNFSRFELLDEQVRLVKGFFKDSLPKMPIQEIAVLRVDGDMYDSTMDILENLYPKLSIGGYVIIDDFGAFHGCDEAVTEYRKKNNITEPFYKQGFYGIYWKKEKN